MQQPAVNFVTDTGSFSNHCGMRETCRLGVTLNSLCNGLESLNRLTSRTDSTQLNQPEVSFRPSIFCTSKVK